MDPNVVRDTSSQYGDNFCEIVVKSDFKLSSYGADTILLQGHAVTLTFKVATQIYVPSFMHLTLIVFKLSKDPDFKRTD